VQINLHRDKHFIGAPPSKGDSMNPGPNGKTLIKGASSGIKVVAAAAKTASIASPTQFVEAKGQTYAYRRLGSGAARPLLCLQHFLGTLDNWDPAVTDPLATSREVVLFDNAGVGRSSGEVPTTVAGMAEHAFAFVDALCLSNCDVLGFSLGGMVALQMAQDRPSIFRKMVLVGTAPRGGSDIMHLEKPSLAKHLQDPMLKGYAVLQKIFFTETATSQSAGKAFIERLIERKQDLDSSSGPEVAANQMAAFREWEQVKGERFVELRSIRQPALVVNGVHDEMIPIANSYRLVENLPNAMLLAYPDSGHGSFFQFHESFVGQAQAFLDAES
jgi:pimeloyl-ACP methyl ester carboxylesterase